MLIPTGPRLLPTGWGGRLVRLGRVWKEGDGPSALERRRERSLVAGARARHAPGQNLPTVADEPAKPRDLLVVDVRDLIDAETAYLAVLALRPSPAAAAAATLFAW